MHKGYQKDGKGRLRYIAVKPEIYDKLIELGSMKDSFNDVITQVLQKNDIKNGKKKD